MANIFACLPGFTLDIDAMELAELMRWHGRAIARAQKE
jgi:hypothetical protein